MEGGKGEGVTEGGTEVGREGLIDGRTIHLRSGIN